MKKLYFVLLVLLGWGLTSQAQMRSNSIGQKEPIAIGIKGGLNLPRMLYLGNESLSRLDQKMSLTPTGGLFVEIPLGNSLMVAPEAMYVQRGTDISYEHISGVNVHYSMNVSYADLRLPVEWRLPIKPYFQPYLVAGAEMGMRLFGQIQMQRTAPVELNDTINVGKANMGLIHAGVFAGLGIRSKFNIGSMSMIVKLNASYHQGVVDTYSQKEKNGSAQSINVNAYQITGSRLPRGIEATLGIAIPLEKPQEDACSTFSKDRYRRRGNRSHLFGY